MVMGMENDASLDHFHWCSFIISSYANELREHAAYFVESYALAVLMDINKGFVKA